MNWLLLFGCDHWDYAPRGGGDRGGEVFLAMVAQQRRATE
jgi:hypothetical protein